MNKLPNLPRFILCLYTSIPNSLKTNKTPLNPHTLKAHSPLDPLIHMTYKDAKQTASLLGEGYGIGFVFLEKDKYFFIDLDYCLQEDNTWSPIVSKILNKFPLAYVEISNSGKGLHLIGKYEGERLNHSCKNLSEKLELYTDGRFCAITEKQSQGSFDAIYTDDLKIIINEYFSFNKSQEPRKEWTTESHPECNPPEDNIELINFLLNKKPTPQEAFGTIVSFKDLFEANELVLSKAYPSMNQSDPYDRSVADAALIYKLHYFLGGNCERVEQIMRLSKLNRDKWDNHINYLPGTILNSPGRYKKCFAHSHRQKDNNPNRPFNQLKLLEYSLYPELTNKMKVLDTSNNLKFLLETFGINMRWNLMTRSRETYLPNFKLFKEDEENEALRLIEDIALINDMPIFRIDKNLTTLAQKDRYHPIVEGLSKNPWDRISRLNDFINTIESATPELSYKLIKRWMVSAIAAAHSETGFSSSGVLVLSGEQYLGKTRWIEALDPFNCDAVKTGALLDPTNKDCIRTLSGFWIAELGELDGTFRKADMARIKSFITEKIDKIRFPHERKDSLLQRRTVFAASVNDSKYLIDETGNRRWWSVPVLSINLNHGIDIVQVWAEVFHLWKEGEQSYMTNEEFIALTSHNKEHEQLNPLEEAIYTFFDFSEGWELKKKKPYSATEVLLKLGYFNPTRSQCTQVGNLLKKMTGKNPERTKCVRLHYLVLKSEQT